MSVALDTNILAYAEGVNCAAMVLSAAAEAGCRLLLSEDLQEGFTWKGVTVTNPLSATKNELLADLLGNNAGS